MVKRGEIWLVDLDPTVGSEINKARPCVVISPPQMHDYLRTVIVAAMTTQGKPASYRIPISFRQRRGLVLLDQIRTLDKKRLIRRLGTMSDTTLSKVLETLQEIFAA